MGVNVVCQYLTASSRQPLLWQKYDDDVRFIKPGC